MRAVQCGKNGFQWEGKVNGSPLIRSGSKISARRLIMFYSIPTVDILGQVSIRRVGQEMDLAPPGCQNDHFFAMTAGSRAD